MAKLPYKRSRTQGGFSPITGKAYYYDPACNEPVRFLYNITGLEVGTLKVTDDVVTPGFKRASGEGKLIVSPYKSSVETQTGGGTFSRVRQMNVISCVATQTRNEFDTQAPVAYYLSTGQLSKRLSPIALISDAEIASLTSIAATKAWAESASHQASVLTDIAEMRQTLQMFTRPLNSIRPLLRAMTTSSKKGVLKKGKDVLGSSGASAQNLWLQYRYGIRPLVSSVQGILKALAQPKGIHRQTYRGNQTLTKSASSPGSVSGWEVTFNYTDDRTDQVQVRTGIVMEEAVSLSTSLGVDAGGLLALPWELVPFSFVADWFINVGSYLQALVPSLTKDPLASWTVVKRKQTRSWNVTNTVAINAALWSVVRPVEEHRYAEFITTTRAPGIQKPSITRRPNSLGNVFSDLRGVDSFALAAQQLGRLLKR